MQPQYITLSKRAQDLTGQRFGRLVALGPVRCSENGRLYWHCRCDCGNEKSIEPTSLTSGRSRSCGCLGAQKSSQRVKERNPKHGMARTRIYNMWAKMIMRCHNSDDFNYPRYGGRGIQVCPEWRNSFEAFYAYMGSRPSPHHSLDRIDNNGDYEPGNVRWATPKEQANNTRGTHFLSFEGQTQSVTEWAEQLGVPRDSLYSRLGRGWTIERTLSTPVKTRSPR